MARIRSIKPEIVQSARLAECSRDARLLFVYLISQADCYGNQRGDGRLIRGQMFPYDDDVTTSLVEDWLDELEKRRLIRRYVLDEQIYVHLPNWGENQKVSKPGPRMAPRAPGQPLADCDDPSLGDPGCAWVTQDETVTTPGATECIGTPPPRAAQGDPGEPRAALADLDLDLDLDLDHDRSPSTTPDDPATTLDAEPDARPRAERVTESEFDEWYSLYPKKVKRQAAIAKYRTVRKRGVDHETLMTGLRRALAFWDRERTDRQFIPDPTTWLNQGRWDDDYGEPDRTPPPDQQISSFERDEQRRKARESFWTAEARAERERAKQQATA